MKDNQIDAILNDTEQERMYIYAKNELRRRFVVSFAIGVSCFLLILHTLLTPKPPDYFVGNPIYLLISLGLMEAITAYIFYGIAECSKEWKSEIKKIMPSVCIFLSVFSFLCMLALIPSALSTSQTLELSLYLYFRTIMCIAFLYNGYDSYRDYKTITKAKKEMSLKS